MNLSSPLKKFTTLSGLTYGYVFQPPSPNKPTILFLHGFPSAAYDWRHQISHFSQSGYGVLAADLLGYGSSSKPDSAQEYKGKRMADDIVALLNHENVDKVHGVGHDWGSYLLSRLANYHSARFYSYSFLGVGYMPPNIVFDLERANAELKREVGYDTFGFWEFFLEDDAAALLRKHFDSFYTLFYPADPPMWKQNLGPTGAMRAWLEGNSVAPMASYVTEQEREKHRNTFKDEYGPALKWFYAYIRNFNEEDEKLANIDPKLDRPVLLITANRDIVATAAVMEKGMRMFAEDVKVKELNTGHWLQLEGKNDVNKILEEFFSDLDLTPHEILHSV